MSRRRLHDHRRQRSIADVGSHESPASRERHQAVVIGAGPAGLAAAATLQGEGGGAAVLERDSVGSSWRKHYDRLHLHTVRLLSDLPGLRIDRREGRWVSRDGVVRYSNGTRGTTA